jgi:DNA-binding NarL/FixJ family response regulator
VLDPVQAERQQPDLRVHLSTRELEVLQMASLGLTNAQIASKLDVTIHAVKFHLAAIYRKLGVTNRTEAAFVFLQAATGRTRSVRKTGS